MGIGITHFMKDPEKSAYWTDLFPDKYQWQVLMDLKVIENLKDYGDDLTVEREICHCAYFDDPNDLQAFGPWAESNGFVKQKVSEPIEDDDRYTLEFFQVSAPQSDQISPVTQMLVDKAEEFRGEYDGWGTNVSRVVH